MRNSGSAVNNLYSAFDSEISSADSNIEQPSVKPNYNVDGLKLCDNFGSHTYSKSFVMTGVNSDPPVFVHLSCVF
jgi:hypothetical protein